MPDQDEPSNFQLQLRIEAMHGDIRIALSRLQDMKDWQLKHENDDKIVHEKLHSRISNMKIVSSGMSVVTLIIGIFTGIKIK